MARISEQMQIEEQQASAQRPVPSLAARDIARRVLGDNFKEKGMSSGLSRPKPCLGVVLGTGMGGLVDRLEEKQSVGFSELGWLPSATAIGHAGRLVWGSVENRTIVILQGRVHAYEGQPAAMLLRGIELFAALGVEKVLLTNASGGLTSDLTVGEIVILQDHIDFVRNILPAKHFRTHEIQLYDKSLSSQSVRVAQSAGYLCRSGVYAYCLGPSYETRAEYRMLKILGADVVGMSTVPEVVVARSFGMKVVAASVVTNLADSLNLSEREPVEGEDVCRAAATAADGMWTIVQNLLQGI
jgi:purine-nucleoside phosphorylase